MEEEKRNHGLVASPYIDDVNIDDFKHDNAPEPSDYVFEDRDR